MVNPVSLHFAGGQVEEFSIFDFGSWILDLGRVRFRAY